MGECGCSAVHPRWKLPAPDGGWYAIEVYTGCEYCDAPAGVVIYRTGFDIDAGLSTEFAELEEAEFHHGEFGVPVIHQRHVFEVLKRLAWGPLEFKNETWTGEEYLESVLDDDRTWLEQAVSKTQKEPLP